MSSLHFDPIEKARAAWRVVSRQARSLRQTARRMGRGKAGVAAVEFALILPMMLVLYFGCAVLAQGLDAGRKTQVLASTLSNLTAQTLAGTYGDGNCAATTTVPCLTDADLLGIFNASTAVLTPYTGKVKMTISEIVFDNIAGTSNCCEAKLVWSAAVGSPNGTTASPRSCQTFNPNGSGTSLIPGGLYPASISNNTGANWKNYYLIVADVSYNYAPSFGFTPFNWGPAGNGNGYTINATSYYAPRNASSQSSTTTQAISWTPGGTISSSGQLTTCPAWTTSSTPPAGDYNVP
jgi:Flp pilus assembly protein TadG